MLTFERYYLNNNLGTPYVRVDPERIKGIVLTDQLDSTKGN